MIFFFLALIVVTISILGYRFNQVELNCIITEGDNYKIGINGPNDGLYRNSSISDSKEIIFEVSQDHRWEISDELSEKKYYGKSDSDSVTRK